MVNEEYSVPGAASTVVRPAQFGLRAMMLAVTYAAFVLATWSAAGTAGIVFVPLYIAVGLVLLSKGDALMPALAGFGAVSLSAAMFDMIAFLLADWQTVGPLAWYAVGLLGAWGGAGIGAYRGGFRIAGALALAPLAGGVIIAAGLVIALVPMMVQDLLSEVF